MHLYITGGHCSSFTSGVHIHANSHINHKCAHKKYYKIDSLSSKLIPHSHKIYWHKFTFHIHSVPPLHLHKTLLTFLNAFTFIELLSHSPEMHVLLLLSYLQQDAIRHMLYSLKMVMLYGHTAFYHIVQCAHVQNRFAKHTCTFS